jgi:hypothetical protein
LVLKRPSRGFCAGSSFFLGGICRGTEGTAQYVHSSVPHAAANGWPAAQPPTAAPGRFNYARRIEAPPPWPSAEGAIGRRSLNGRATIAARRQQDSSCPMSGLRNRSMRPNQHPPCSAAASDGRCRCRQA